MENKKSKGELIAVAIMVICAGLSLMATGIWTARQLHIVWNVWPSTDGVVARSEVQDVANLPYSKAGIPFQGYSATVSFAYRVRGTVYITEAPSIYTADSREQAAKLVRLYTPGTHHPILYDSRNPRDIRFGRIEYGPVVFSLLFLALGAVLSALGLKWAVIAFSPRAEMAPAMKVGSAANVQAFTNRARPAPPTETVHCPSCGRPVMATDDTCPNCLKALRAA